MGTKSMLENLKRCLPAPAVHVTKVIALAVPVRSTAPIAVVAAILKGTVAAPVAKLSKALFQNFR